MEVGGSRVVDTDIVFVLMEMTVDDAKENNTDIIFSYSRPNEMYLGNARNVNTDITRVCIPRAGRNGDQWRQGQYHRRHGDVYRTKNDR